MGPVDTMPLRHGQARSPVAVDLPDGLEPRNLPLVLVVHGGPWMHDARGYSGDARFLANRGHAVLQVTGPRTTPPHRRHRRVRPRHGEDEGHGFADPENRIRLYRAFERHLAEHLGGRRSGTPVSPAPSPRTR